MIERVVENWLTRVNELTLQIPFCQLLSGEGYQVVHLSRHGPAEEGKDVLAIAPDGVPCAFQLKGASGGKMTLKAWEAYVHQVIRLVEVPIRHPSINTATPRRVYLVTNGELDEEVKIEIANRNIDWRRRDLPELETIVKGQLLARFQKLHTNLWPTQLTSERTLLEFFLSDGTDHLRKDSLAKFILDLLPMPGDQLNKAECSRALASAGIFAAYALSSYSEKSNHVALIEGWVVYVACLVALVEKYSLEEKYWKDSLTITKHAIERLFEDLCAEIQNRKNLIEGHTLVDFLFYRGRVTWLIGLLATFVLWKRLNNPNWQIPEWLCAFVRSNQKYLALWGEAAVPQFLALIWFLRQITATREPDILLSTMIQNICLANNPNIDGQNKGLADPYHGLAEVVENQTGIAEEYQTENYKGRSYILESLVQLFARRGWRQQLRLMWYDITSLEYAEFCPQLSWQYCLWESNDGQLVISRAQGPQSWAELKKEAETVNLVGIPKPFQDHPELLLLFVLTYPHRLRREVAKFLDDRINSFQKN